MTELQRLRVFFRSNRSLEISEVYCEQSSDMLSGTASMLEWVKRSGARGFLWLGAAFVTILALGLWLRPYVLSIFHLEAGGRALEAALEPVFPDRLAPEQIVDAERLQDGAAHLQEALRWDPRNVQAMRLLARVHVTRGQPEAALEILQRALDVRPSHPLLYLELGDVYDSLGQAVEAVEAYKTGRVGSRATPLTANYLKLADVQAEWGSGEYAIQLWRQALEYGPDNLYALYRLMEIHRMLGDDVHAAAFEERLDRLEPYSVTAPLDPRLAQYQGQAMVALVEGGIWERDELFEVVAFQVEQYAEGTPGAMVEQVLTAMLESWPEEPELLFYLGELYHRREEPERAENGEREKQ